MEQSTTLGELLDQRANEFGDAEALRFPAERMTYLGLASRADAAARGMVSLGVRAGDRVGILLPNCVDSLAFLFGAMKIGAVPVPVNGRFKEVELRQVVVHSGMRLLITSAADGQGTDFPSLLRGTFPGLTECRVDSANAPELRHVIVLGAGSGERFFELADTVKQSVVVRRQELVSGADTAMILYTSGTTASPKGAMISHDAFLRFADGVVRTRFDLTPQDRVWTALPFFHVGGIAFAIATLFAGAVYCHVGAFDPAVALKQLVELRCTVALAGFETIWLPVLAQPDFATADLGSLRAVMALGVPERLRAMQAKTPGAVLVTSYGQTEACSFLTLNHLDETLEQRTNTGGLPLPGMEVRVVDPLSGVDVPAGTPGELLYRGGNMFDGYFRDDELTAQAIDHDGWFHTGDLVRRDARGRVSFLSRLKDMLKVGGENVAAAEVEEHLLRHPAVAFAQVVAAPDARYTEVPAAFLQLHEGADVTEAEIIDFCRGRIATFRVPRYVRFVTEWPMSGTKIKKYVLRERIARELEQSGVTEAPKMYSMPHSTLREAV